jgi:tetratricopeptide (TPR) repeat protein
LAGEYLELDSNDLALKTALEALDLAPEQAVIHHLLGEIYLRRREVENARDGFARGKDLDPSIIEAGIGFIRSCLDLGDYSSAASELDSRISRHPLSLDLMKLYYDLPAEFANNATKQKMTKTILDGSYVQKDTPTGRAFLRTRAYEFSEDIENTWAHARKANQLVSKEHAADIRNELGEIATRTNWLLNNSSSISTSSCVDSSSPTTLFIFGPSRSGKTTLEGLLGQHPNVQKGYENPIIRKAIETAYHEAGFFPTRSMAHLPPQFYPNVTKHYTANLPIFSESHCVFTNTTPGYLWDAPFFHSVIPNSRFVFVKRNIDDLIWRIYTKSYRAGNWYSYDLSSLKEYITKYYQIVDLMADLMPQKVRVINYEELVSNPADICTDVLADCGVSTDASLSYGEVQNDVGCSNLFQALMQSEIEREL